MKIHRSPPRWRLIVRTLGRLLFRWAENNDDGRIERNGEGWLLRQALAAHVRNGTTRPFVMFDVGANIGLYSRLAVQEARRFGCGIEVHAFEPSPAAADRLGGLVGHEAFIKVVRVALSDRTGEAPLHAGETGSGHASLVLRDSPDSLVTGAITVKLQRLDDYLKQNDLGRIDLLKIDVEGSELAVLQGLGEWLSPHTVKIIQFEYGGATRDARVSLRDLERILVAHGYAFAKLLPRSLEVRAYREWMDNYSYANYVALAPTGSRGTAT
jgi:FkbM family methyltransferase